jgi:GrpB-like predicted nucleotidyltransferase (UPF0157 family)
MGDNPLAGYRVTVRFLLRDALRPSPFEEKHYKETKQR